MNTGIIIQAVNEYFVSGGWLMYPICLASVGIWFFYITGYMRLRRAVESTRRRDRDCACRKRGDDISCNLREFKVLQIKHDLVMLAALAAAAPLLGLLGTVFGMIDTFNAVAVSDGDTSFMVADGIRLALVTTRAGLAAALPGTFGLAHLTWLNGKLAKQIRINRESGSPSGVIS